MPSVSPSVTRAAQLAVIEDLSCAVWTSIARRRWCIRSTHGCGDKQPRASVTTTKDDDDADAWKMIDWQKRSRPAVWHNSSPTANFLNVVSDACCSAAHLARHLCDANEWKLEWLLQPTNAKYRTPISISHECRELAQYMGWSNETWH